MTIIETCGKANHAVSLALATLRVPHTERRIDDDRVEFTVDLPTEDAAVVVDLALGK